MEEEGIASEGKGQMGVEQMNISSFQFQFHRVDGAVPPSSERLDRGIISTVLPDGQRVLLKLSSNLTRSLVDPYKK